LEGPVIEPHDTYQTICTLLDELRVEHHLFHHRPVLSFADAHAVRREVGYAGSESKSLVIRTADGFAVATTTEEDLKRVRAHLGGGKVRLATPSELRDHFGAEPGCAYPFGFAPDIPILVDPAIFEPEWLLFSPAVPTATVQVRTRDLRRLYAALPNPVAELPDLAG
jgi:Ala-tRNA(Pro) deacylase